MPRRPALSPVPLILLMMLAFAASSESWAKDGPIRSLSSGEKLSVVGGSFGLGLLTQALPDKRSHAPEYSHYRANAFDRWWRNQIHGGTGRRSNFIDNKRGSLVAPAAGLLTLSLLDINRREFSRDIPFLLAGAVATGAVTNLGKRLMHRPRPYCQEGGALPPDRSPDDSYHTESFFSGHSSQAFFAAGFVNNRLRRHMRQEWTREEYRSWRWASPLITYGWAGFVGWSRVQADKHHFTDVCVGAMVGYAISELYYRLAYEPGVTPEAQSQLFSLQWQF